MTGIVGALAAVLNLWWRRAKTRRDLATLDDRLRGDVGLDARDVARETRKRCWQA